MQVAAIDSFKIDTHVHWHNDTISGFKDNLEWCSHVPLARCWKDILYLSWRRGVGRTRLLSRWLNTYPGASHSPSGELVHVRLLRKLQTTHACTHTHARMDTYTHKLLAIKLYLGYEPYDLFCQSNRTNHCLNLSFRQLGEFFAINVVFCKVSRALLIYFNMSMS